MIRDALSIIESAYAESDDPDRWLDGALAALYAQLDEGEGVLARRFHVQGPSVWQGEIKSIAVVPEEVAAVDRAADWLKTLPPAAAMEVARKMFPLAPVATHLSQIVGRPMMAQLTSTYPRPVRDTLGVIAADPSGHGCVFFRNEENPRALSHRTTSLWERIAAHLVTGYRLARERQTKAEAVLDPGGKLLHRENEVSRDDAGALSDATKAIDRARGRMRRVEPERAIALWQGLVSGRWSLVDQFDHDGRRYVVAKRNELTTRGWSALSAREAQILAYLGEGQPPKLIAYQLGLSPATVNGSLTRTMRKLSVRSRFELVTAYRAHRGEQESA
jgi:DNA-binding CsgD family transcriptional regulator